MTSVTVQLSDREIKMLKARTGERMKVEAVRIQKESQPHLASTAVISAFR